MASLPDRDDEAQEAAAAREEALAGLTSALGGGASRGGRGGGRNSITRNFSSPLHVRACALDDVPLADDVAPDAPLLADPSGVVASPSPSPSPSAASPAPPVARMSSQVDDNEAPATLDEHAAIVMSILQVGGEVVLGHGSLYFL